MHLVHTEGSEDICLARVTVVGCAALLGRPTLPRALLQRPDRLLRISQGLRHPDQLQLQFGSAVHGRTRSLFVSLSGRLQMADLLLQIRIRLRRFVQLLSQPILQRADAGSIRQMSGRTN